ncbi:MAG: HEPN domain-containing protein [Candidatus Lambdaproteobacteria bacterium]|nr:HEPN domain-containing protein [Candidatus Lambdaproteobacteria bacterium]
MAALSAALLDVAEWLAAGESIRGVAPEALFRTSINRAYYAAFHQGRAFLRVRVSDRMRHGVLIARIRASGGEGHYVADKLRALYVLREKADYDLDREINREDAVNALALCHELMAQFERQP